MFTKFCLDSYYLEVFLTFIVFLLFSLFFFFLLLDTPGELHAVTPRRVAGHFYPFNGARRSVHGYIPAVPVETGLENQAYAYDSHPRRYMPTRFASKREPSQQILLNDTLKSSSDSFYNRPV